MLLTPTLVSAQTPAGTPISNQATGTYDLGASSGLIQNSNIDINVVVPPGTSATLEFLEYAPGAPGASTQNVPPSECSSSGLPAGPFNPVPPPSAGGAPIGLPGPLDLLSAGQYSLGAPVFLSLADGDQNLDSLVAESVLVALTSGSGDSELVRLFETGPNTGIFNGHIQLVSGPTASNDCVLQAGTGDALQASYTDPGGGGDVANAAASVSPVSVAFDGRTGALLDGIQLTLIDDASGLPAVVFGDDGISPFPATLVTGGTATDGTTIYNFPSGGYRFPVVPAGSYRLDITPTPNYVAPSAETDPGLQLLPGNPFALNPGSRGLSFAVGASGSFDVDIPLDLAAASLFISKTANVNSVGRGGFVQYRIEVRNSGVVDAPLGMQVTDVLPLGFRYEPGSAKLDGVSVPDPTVSIDARSLVFDLGTTPAPQFQVVTYVTRVTAGAKLGRATNQATSLVIGGGQSFTAKNTVQVREDLFTQATFLMGHIAVGECGSEPDPEVPGLKGIRVYLEDGSYTHSDANGFFQFEGVRAGVHGVQLDLESLPIQYEPVVCHQNTRFAGRSFSQFVDVQPGTLWRTDFRVSLKRRARGFINARLESQHSGESIAHNLRLRGGQVDIRNLSANVILPEGLEYEPGSSSASGKELPDPEIQGPVLIYRLGDRRSEWETLLHFRARVTPGTEIDGLKTRVFARFATPQDSNARSGFAETELRTGLITQSKLVILETVGLREGETWADELPASVDPKTADQTSASEPVYDDVWLAKAEPGFKVLSPAENFAPALPSLRTVIQHAPNTELELSLNGSRVPKYHLGEYLVNARKTAALSVYQGMDLKVGANRLEIVERRPDGVETARAIREFHYSGPPIRAEIVPERSSLVANGRDPVNIAVRLFDRFDQPTREGVVVEFGAELPHLPLDERSEGEKRQILGIETVRPTFTVGKDGIGLIQLEPTAQSGRVDAHLILAGDRKEEVRTWVEPEQREWVLVGLAHGSLGAAQVDGNENSLNELDQLETTIDDRRVALFAKGTVRGDWLLTVAFDSTAQAESQASSLKQLVDPDRYYTLYGSDSKQRFEAPSSERLYLKIERSRFFALFGDFDSGLEVSELSRYNRSFTGFKSEFDGDRFGFNTFLSDTAQAFLRDEIRGDGTSGLYRLSSQDLVINSETVSVETRDRFKTHEIVSKQEMTRYVDYNIDYTDGTLFFSAPIASKDSDLNPIFIVTEYETQDDDKKAVVAGGRGSARFMDNRLEFGATTIHEGASDKGGLLLGGDVRFDFDNTTQLRAEFAGTDTEEGNTDKTGAGYLVEVEKRSERFNGIAYLREQETDFGLGQQAQTEQGSRKVGFETAYTASEQVQYVGEAYRQSNLDANTDRDVLEARSDFRNQSLGLFGGVRFARDSGASQSNSTSKQVLAGGNYGLYDGRMDVRLNTEISVGENDNPDFPSRVVMGSDYHLTPKVTIFGEQEWAFGSDQDSTGTRAGFRASPWAGATSTTTLGQDMTGSGPTSFANFGLSQTWEFNDRWSFLGSVDHAKTFRKPGAKQFDADVPLSSGTVADDFTALSLGANYRAENWSWTGRAETRAGESRDKWGLYTGFVQEVNEGFGYNLAVDYFRADEEVGADRDESSARLGLVFRPVESRWIVLNRLDWVSENEAGGDFDFDNRKLINNIHLNYQWDPQTQLSVFYGAKFATDTIDDVSYAGFTDAWGLEMRRDVGAQWDVGARVRSKNSWDADIHELSYGLELGYRLRKNLWLSGGYNFSGFEDSDFSGADYSRKGPFIKFRFKFDQVTIEEILTQEGKKP